MLRSLFEKFYSKLVYPAQELSATTATLSVDLQLLSNFAFEVLVGAFTFTGVNKVNLNVQHSEDNATWADVTADDLYPEAEGPAPTVKILDAAGDASKVHLIPYRGNMRYVRLNMVVAGTVSAPMAVSGISTKPEQMPKP